MAKALGTDDSITTCDCCGRTNLKFTVAMRLDDGEIVHYGQVCAGRNTGKTSATINSEIKAEKVRRVNAATAELMASPEYVALREKLAIRPRGLIGMKAVEFIEAERDAEMAARKAIAAKHGLTGPFAFSI